MLIRGSDGHIPFSNPVADAAKATYPEGDLCRNAPRPLYEIYGVNAKRVRASVEAGNEGYPGRVFDEFTVAK